MDTIAAVITGKSSAAISSIAVYGSGCIQACQSLVDTELNIDNGNFKLCRVVKNGDVVDEVLIACEAKDLCVINSHGNPLIVDIITSMLADFGVDILSGEDFAKTVLCSNRDIDSITAEIKIVQNRAFSIQTVRLVQSQRLAGLGKFVDECLNAEKIDLADFEKKCRLILKRSKIGEKLLKTLKIVIAGLPNSGKSLLFNRLCGRQAAIVADFHGTTRDWLSAKCMLGSISAELIDTAGIDQSLQGIDHIDSLSRKNAAELIEQADIILNVCDINTAQSLQSLQTEDFINKAGKGIVIKVYNKADSYSGDKEFNDGVMISALRNEGIKELVEKIIELCEVETLKAEDAVCFTERQKRLLEQALDAKEDCRIKLLLKEIKEGSL